MTIYNAGRSAFKAAAPSSGLPAWLDGVGLHEWVEISGTNGRITTAVVNGVTEAVMTAGDGWLDAWGAITVNPNTSELYTGAAGGHGDSSDNRMISIPLEDDAPTWVLRSQPSPGSRPTDETSGYYPDGLPVARHHYDNLFFLPSIGRVMMLGGRAIWGSGGPETAAITGFNVATNTWDPAGTYISVRQSGGTHFGMVCNQRAGQFFGVTIGGASDRFTAPATVSGTGLGSYVNGSVTGFSAVTSRWPCAWDSVRQECFILNWGNGEGGDTGFGTQAYRWADTGGVAADTISFNSSAAYTAWQAAAPQYASMDYDPENERYLFLHGGENGKVYVITPAAGNTWDMSVQTITGTAPTSAPSAGTNGRFKYVPRLKGFVYLPRANSNLYFFRVA